VDLAVVSAEVLAMDGDTATEEDLVKEVEHFPATRVSSSFSLDLMSYFG